MFEDSLIESGNKLKTKRLSTTILSFTLQVFLICIFQWATSISIATLLNKPERRKVQVTPRYCGFTIPDKFVVGYGLDYAEDFRNLKDVCILEN